MKQKGLNDIIKIGKFEIMFYDNPTQLDDSAQIGDLLRCHTKECLTEAVGEAETLPAWNIISIDIYTEWLTQRDKIMSELYKLQMSNKKFIFRIYYNYKD